MTRLALLFAALVATTTAARAASNASADSLVAAAVAAEHANDNKSAASLFERALASDPRRRAQILPDLADQLTYSGQAARAVPLYREVLATPSLSADRVLHAQTGLALALLWSRQLPAAQRAYESILRAHPSDVDALLNSAQALAWQNKLAPAERRYDAVLAIDPDNRSALDGSARIDNWRGLHRSARRRATVALRRNPNDSDAQLVLAQADLWMGRPDLSAIDARSLFDGAGKSSSTIGFAADLADARRAFVTSEATSSTQSDALLIRSETFEAGVKANDGAATFGVRYHPIAYLGRDPATTAFENRAGAFGDVRFNDTFELHADVADDEIRAAGATNHDPFLYNTYATIYPSDQLRVDVGARRESFDNVQSLALGVTNNIQSASIDFAPDERTKVSLRGYHGTVSDGNREGWEQIAAETEVVAVPHLYIGGRATTFSFASSPNHGYFDPSRDSTAELTAHLYDNFASKLYYDVSLSGGHEWTQNGGNRPTHAEHGQLSYVVNRSLTASAVFDSFDTRQISNGGFARTTVGFQLQTRL